MSQRTPPLELSLKDGETVNSCPLLKEGRGEVFVPTPPLNLLSPTQGRGRSERETNGKFILILPNIRSAHNVGAMFRTADGAGVDKIYLTGYTPCPPHPRLDKVSLGAEKWMPWEFVKQTGRLLKQLKEKGYNIVALEQTKESLNLYDCSPQFPLALVVGNEKTGVTKAMLKYCDQSVELPMRGRKKSLNVSVAAGIAMFCINEKIKNQKSKL